ncbi:hypothetical protein IPF37_05490 [bacterium]|nr:MAG: hypothetical protein IPF37_05490 [bacterium]
MKFGRLLIISFISTLGMTSTIMPGNIHDIKGTWNILSPESRIRLSPTCGALGIEMGYIEKLYHFSNQDDATVHLIKQLFHAFPGSIAPSQFGLAAKFTTATIGALLNTLEKTHKKSNDDRFTAIVHTVVTDQSLQKAVGSETLSEDYQKYQASESLDHQIIADLKNKATHHLKISFKDAKKKTLLELLKLLESLPEERLNDEVKELITKCKAWEQIDTTKKQLSKDSIAIFKSIETFAHTLIDACDECNPAKNADESSASSASSLQLKQNLIYRPYTAQHALLAWVYKTINSKKDFVPFFQKIHADLFTEQVDFLDAEWLSEWVDDIFQIDDNINLHTKFLKTFAPKTSQEVIELCDDNYFDELLFMEVKYQLYGQNIPILPNSRQIFFRSHKFSDCSEMLLLNLCNIITYDKKTGTFGNQPENLVMPDMLKNFYAEEDINGIKINALEKTTGDLTVRQSWSNLLQNKPYIIYHNAWNPNNSNYYYEFPKDSPEKIVGFIKLPDIIIPENIPTGQKTLIAKNMSTNHVSANSPSHTFNYVTVNKNSYLLVENDEYELFEIMPFIRNIIIMMDRIWHLQLFLDKKQSIHNFFQSSFFNSTYFKQLCDKCDFEIDKKILPNLDYELKEYSFSLSKKSCSAFFYIALVPPRHIYAQRSPMPSSLLDYAQPLQKYLNQNLEKIKNPIAPLIFDLYRPSNSEAQTIYRFFTQNLFEDDEKTEIIEDIIESKKTEPELASLVNQLIKNLNVKDNLEAQLAIAKSLHDGIYFIRNNRNNFHTKEALALFVNKIIDHHNTSVLLEIFDYIIPLLQILNDNDTITKIADWFIHKSTHENTEQALPALKLLLDLVINDNHDFFSAATTAANHTILNENHTLYNIATKIIITLINKDYEPALQVGTALAVKKEQSKITFIFLELLLKKGYAPALQPITDIASQLSNSDNYESKKLGFQFFKALIEKNYIPALDTATTTAIQQNFDKNPEYKKFGSMLLKTLIEKNYEPALQATIDLAIKLCSRDNTEDKDSGLFLLNLLITKNCRSAFEITTQTAFELSSNNNETIAFACLNLLEKLVEKKYAKALRHAYQAASNNLQKDDFLKSKSMTLLKALCAQHYIPALKTTLQLAINNSNKSIAEQHLSLELFDTLFQQGYEPAIKAALPIIKEKSNGPNKRLQGFASLLKKNIDKYYDIPPDFEF